MNFTFKLGMVIHTCNHSYLGSGNQDCSLRPAQVKSQQDFISNKKGRVCVLVTPAMGEASIGLQFHAGQKHEILFKNN
jgi:hypothetical protein